MILLGDKKYEEITNALLEYQNEKKPEPSVKHKFFIIFRNRT